MAGRTRRLRPWLIGTLCGVCLWAKAGAAADEGALGREVAAAMREYHVAGIAIAVTDHGRQRFYNFGVASRQTRRPVDSDTLFEIGSVSKTFTATLAAYAQVQGRLSLGDSPARFYPELRGHALQAVSLVELGTHTSGGFPLQLPDEIRTPAQLMRYFEDWAPRDAPGTQRRYANPSIALLGMAAAKAFDMPFKSAVEELLLPRLGLHDTFIEVPARKLNAYAQGYDKTDAPVRVNPGVIAEEAYGVKTSAKDLIRFVELNLDPSRLDASLGHAVLDTHIGYFKLGAMTQDLVWEQYDEPVGLAALLEGNGPRVSAQGNPVEAIDPPRPAAQAVWVNKTGSTNGFGTYVAFLPARRLGIVILANKNFPIEARVRLAYLVLGQDSKH